MNQSTNTAATRFRAVAIQAWQDRGSRRTTVREVICDVIGEFNRPFTAEGVLPIARRTDRGISMASVYRTLGDLAEFGLLHERRGAANEMCYTVVDPAEASAVPHSATVVCRDCGHLQQVEDPCLTMREGPLAKQAGFNLRKLELRMEADCDTLQQTGACQHRPKTKEDT